MAATIRFNDKKLKGEKMIIIKVKTKDGELIEKGNQ